MDLNRLRDIVRGSSARPHARELTYVPEVGPRSSLSPYDLAETMRGIAIQTEAGPCLLIERIYEGWRYHGRQRIGDWNLGCSCEDAPDSPSGCHPLRVLGRAWPAGTLEETPPDGRPRLLYLDLETTGLTGGAGNHAFLVGCGYFDRDGAFVTRQLFLTSFGGERALLTLLSGWVAGIDAIVTYNGRTFDVPVIETRWLFHRMPPPLGEKPHFDMLHPARCLWRDRDRAAERPSWEYADSAGEAPSPEGASCSLGTLERWLLGFTRIGDVGGFEIPALYFQYLRTGDVEPLEAVLEHNRLDLLSLAGVSARVARLVGQGAAAADGARECIALGRLYEKAGEFDRAAACYARAAGVAASGNGGDWTADDSDPVLRGEALRRLALRYRRERRYAEAAGIWRRVLDLEHRTPLLDREAVEALAIHHEHRVKDLDRARDFALRALRSERDADRRRAVHHRLARLEKKLDRRPAGASLL
jgi:hypothetical protein